MKPPGLLTALLAAIVTLTSGWVETASAAATSPEAPAPDCTRGGKKDDSHDWTLGPTGARGWIYGRAGQTREARQILVTETAAASPADGILLPGDVILGVNGAPFTDDARITFARAITAAEAEDGVLRMTRWRGGEVNDVEVKLPVLGAYGDTTPYDCAKSKRIFDAGCRAIAGRGPGNVSIPNSLNGLALLASGRDEYRPALAGYARKVAGYHPDDLISWHYGYAGLFLAEYVAATGDRSVMDGLRRISGEIARGQSAVGTWGHDFSLPGGNCSGYGCMNSPGIVLTLALVVAREAGVRDPVVDRAIDRAGAFLRWYVDKGAIPYGDHLPWPGHEDNGKCSGAAVLFDLLGDREAAGYFAKMSTAAYDERERGHTGNFFNMLWALPGVARCGPLATGAYWKEQGWYYDLARGWDGSFIYQGSPVGEEEHMKYTGWDSTGAYLLAYALPSKSLYLTGRKPCQVPPLGRAEVAGVIAAGRDYFSSDRGKAYLGRPASQLLEGLSSWSPAVRKRSAAALARAEGDFVPELIRLLDHPDRHARYGACEALGFLGPRADAAGPRLRVLLNDPDPWMQSLAASALPALGPDQRRASVSDLLAMSARPNPADPRRMTERAACAALFRPYPGSGGPRSLLAESLEGIDRPLLHPAIESALRNDDGAARGAVASIYGKLTDRDLVTLLPAILKAVGQLAPSNEMFGDDIRLAGLDLLSRLHIREAMPLCISIVEPDRWGEGRRLTECIACLSRYGSHAKALIPELRELRRGFVALPHRGEGSELVKAIDQTIAAIESSTAAPTLVSVKEFRVEARACGSHPDHGISHL